MFRRNNRSFFPSASRVARRASKSILRANRRDEKFMQRYRERQQRFARYKRAYSFLPMNLRSFRAMWFAFTTMLSSIFQPARPSLVHTNRDGMLGRRRKRRRNKKNSRSGKAASSDKTYEAMEPRQMLAADLMIGLNLTDAELTITDTGTVDNLSLIHI